MSIKDYIKGKDKVTDEKGTLPEGLQTSDTLEFIRGVISTALIEYAPTSRFEEIVGDVVDAYVDLGSKVVLLVSPATRATAYLERLSDHIAGKRIRLVKVSASARTDHFYSVDGYKDKTDLEEAMTEISVDWLEYLSEIIEGLDNKSAVVFEPISDILLINGFEKSFKFIKKTIDYCADRGIKVTCFINSEAHTDLIKASFEGLFTNIGRVKDGKLMLLK